MQQTLQPAATYDSLEWFERKTHRGRLTDAVLPRGGDQIYSVRKASVLVGSNFRIRRVREQRVRSAQVPPVYSTDGPGVRKYWQAHRAFRLSAALLRKGMTIAEQEQKSKALQFRGGGGLLLLGAPRAKAFLGQPHDTNLNDIASARPSPTYGGRKRPKRMLQTSLRRGNSTTLEVSEQAGIGDGKRAELVGFRRRGLTVQRSIQRAV